MANIIERSISVPTTGGQIYGDWKTPAGAEAAVIFAHGSGSSRLSQRNRFVAQCLNRAGFATLLIDLLTLREEQKDQLDSSLRFDIPFLSQRLEIITDWFLNDSPMRHNYEIGYFGASTGAAAALTAASRLGDVVKAVVSRGGRPDLAAPVLPDVKAPVLFIVGSFDLEVLELNREALKSLGSRTKRLEIIPGATHLFEEKGALAQVAEYAAVWFRRYLPCRNPVQSAAFMRDPRH